MRKFLVSKFYKLLGILAIALTMIVAKALTKVVLSWFNYSPAQQQAIGNQVGDYVGKGLLGAALVVGAVVTFREYFGTPSAKGGDSPPPRPTRPSLPTRAALPPPLPSSLPSPPQSAGCPHCGRTKYHSLGCPNRGT